jgi:hypothetical protein
MENAGKNCRVFGTAETEYGEQSVLSAEATGLGVIRETICQRNQARNS